MKENRTKRDPLFDTVKILLIILVIIGHTMDYLKLRYDWAYIYNFIYMFHIPAFVFVSGYFSKNLTLNKLYKVLLQMIEIYIIYQILYLLIGNKSISITSILVPQHIMWYICSFILWKSSIYIVNKYFKRFTWIIFFLSLLLSFISGYLPFNCVLALSRTIIFYPFFLLGYLTTENTIKKIRKNKATLWVSILFFIICILINHYIQKYSVYHLLYANNPFSDYHQSKKTLLTFRIIMQLNALSMIFIFLKLVPSNLPFKLSNYGKWTLTIYIYHYAIIIFLYKYFDNFPASISTIIIVITTTFSCAILARWNYINYISHPITESILKKK